MIDVNKEYGDLYKEIQNGMKMLEQAGYAVPPPGKVPKMPRAARPKPVSSAPKKIHWDMLFAIGALFLLQELGVSFELSVFGAIAVLILVR